MKVKRIDIPRKRRFVDTQAESHDRPIFAVEIADDFVTLFCKGPVSAFWNNGTDHNPNRYHCELEHNLWIDQQYPGKSIEGWSQHIHLQIVNARWPDFEEYLPHMSDSLSAAIKASFEE